MHVIDGKEYVSSTEMGEMIGKSRHTIELWYKAGELVGWVNLPCILPPRIETKTRGRTARLIPKESVGLFLYFQDNIKPGSLKPAMDYTRSKIGLDAKHAELNKYKHYFED